MCCEFSSEWLFIPYETSIIRIMQSFLDHRPVQYAHKERRQKSIGLLLELVLYMTAMSLAFCNTRRTRIILKRQQYILMPIRFGPWIRLQKTAVLWSPVDNLRIVQNRLQFGKCLLRLKKIWRMTLPLTIATRRWTCRRWSPSTSHRNPRWFAVSSGIKQRIDCWA